MSEPTLDLLDPAFYADPYPVYAALRREAPVTRVRLRDGRGAWLVTRYHDVAAVLQDHARFSSRAMLSQAAPIPNLSPGAREVMELFGHIMSSFDPPDHTRLRGLVQKAFAPRLIEAMRGDVQGLADEFLDAVEARAARGGERRMELVADYAFPLPAAVIMRLLGVPDEDRDNIRVWSEPLMRFDRSAESAEALAPEVGVFIRYVRSLLEARRRAPRDDLLSRLVAQEQERLSEMELVSLTFQLIFAGHSTTSHLIANGTLALLTHPDQLARLRADPSLMPGAVDELLRYDAPQQLRARLAAADAEVGGVTIRRGEVVLLALASGNRDADRFARPDELDVGRGDRQHLSFGMGIHRCFGVPLARLEGEIALATLFRRMPGLRLDVPPGTLSWPPSGLFQRGVAALPLAF